MQTVTQDRYCTLVVSRPALHCPCFGMLGINGYIFRFSLTIQSILTTREKGHRVISEDDFPDQPVLLYCLMMAIAVC